MSQLACFGLHWDQNAKECSGGYDAAYVSPSGSNTRPRCSAYESCRTRTAMRKTMEAQQQQVIPPTNLFNRQNSQPQPPPPQPVSTPWTSTRAQPNLPPAAQGRLPPPPQPVAPPPQQPVPQYQQQWVHPPQPVQLPQPPMMPQMHPMMAQQMQQQMDAMYMQAQYMQYMMQMQQHAAYMGHGGGGVFPPPMYPGMSPVPMGMNPIQFMPMHQYVPQYLSTNEPSRTTDPWRGLLFEVLRGVGKAFGHSLAHYLDNVSFSRNRLHR